MISIRQKLYAIKKAAERVLRRGEPPYLKVILKEAFGGLVDFAWGKPLTGFRPVVAGRTIVDNKEITKLISSLYEDLEVGYDEVVSLTESSLSSYERLSSVSAGLRSRLLAVKQDAEALAVASSSSYGSLFQDSFFDTSKVDLDRTTVAINPEEGICTLANDLSASRPVDLNKATLVREVVGDGGTIRGSILQALTSYRNEALLVSLPKGVEYEGVVNLTGMSTAPGAEDELLANSVMLDMGGVGTIEVSTSVDGINWEVVHSGLANTPTTVRFQQRYVGFLRARVTGVGGVFLLRRMLLSCMGYARTGTLYSTQFSAGSSTSPISVVKLVLDASSPIGTSIRGYISTASGGPWVSISQDPVSLYDIASSKEVTTESTAFARESGTSRFFKFVHPDFSAGSQTAPLVDSGDLFWGIDGFRVESFMQDWAMYGDPNHVPTLDDWSSPPTTVRWCMLKDKGVMSLSDSWTHRSSGNIRQLSTGGYTSHIAILVSDSSSGHSLVPSYNYRFTTWVFASEPRTLVSQTAVCYYPGALNTSTVHAPFSIYLNGSPIYHQTLITTGTTFESSRSADWVFRQGWNKVELLVYRPSVVGSAHGIGMIVFAPNLWHTDREGLYHITDMAAAGPTVRRTSEFKLRWSTPISSMTSWAWAQDSLGQATYALTNFDPGQTAYPYIDGQTSGVVALTKVRYKHPIGDQGYSLFFRADLSTTNDASYPPVINGYSIYEVS